MSDEQVQENQHHAIITSGQNTPQNTREIPEAFKRNLWQPGQSGNPGGRPKRKPLTDELERIIDETYSKDKTYARKLMESAVRRAIKKSDFALSQVWERLEGKVPQAVTGANGGPMQFQVAVMYGSADPQQVVVEGDDNGQE